jgi:hypothetical protein
MSEIDPDYTALADDPAVSLKIPELRIDMKVILLALRYELLHQKIYFSPRFYMKRSHVIVPSLRYRFCTWYDDGFIRIKINRTEYKVPCFLDEDVVSERTIDLLCAIIEHKKINDL